MGEPDSFLWYPVTGPDVMCTNRNRGSSLWISGNTLIVWGCFSTEEIARKSYGLSIPVGIYNCTGCALGQPVLADDVLSMTLTGLGNLQGCLLKSFMLQDCVPVQAVEKKGQPASQERLLPSWYFRVCIDFFIFFNAHGILFSFLHPCKYVPP